MDDLTSLQAKVNALFIKGFEIPAEKLTPTASLYEDLGLDSLDAVDMLVHLEEQFHIKVDGERLMEVRTLQNVYDLVLEVASPSLTGLSFSGLAPVVSDLDANPEPKVRRRDAAAGAV
jgi:acyl carrier protein